MSDFEMRENSMLEVYLMTVSSGIEMDIVESILRCEGIPFIKRYPGIGGIAQACRGYFNADIEIFVSSEDLQRAKDAVQKKRRSCRK